MEHALFIQDLAVVMLVAGVVTLLFHQFKQPVVLGYLLAGFIVGPWTPPFPLVHDEATIKTLSELGVILLMFSLGLHFSLSKLKQVGLVALVASLLEIILMCGIGYVVGRAFGWSRMDCIFLGALLSISSTTIIAKALEELGLEKAKFAEMIFGILIVEDILAIAMLALLSGLGTTEALAWGEVGLKLGRLILFMVTLLIVGLLVVPRLLDYVIKFRSREMLLITSLALCFGVSLLAMKLGYSVALGAFLIGAILGETQHHHRVSEVVHSVRDMFSAIFFVAVGMLIQPMVLAQYWRPILIITFVVIVGKVLSCSLGALLAGNDLKSSLRVGMGLAQIGEFSFIIASLGLSLGVTSHFLYPIAVAVSALTTLSTPYLIRYSDAFARGVEKIAPRPVLRFLDFYLESIQRLQRDRGTPAREIIRALVRKILLQIGINFILITALFVIANGAHVWLASGPWEPPRFLGGWPVFLWMTALVAALPVVVATFLKLRALGMLAGELIVGAQAGSEALVAALRGAISRTVLIVGFGFQMLWIIGISATLLPSWEALAGLSAVGLGLALIFWKKFVGLYAEAQFALHATLNPLPAEEASPPAPESSPMSDVLKEAQLEAVKISEFSWVVGRKIRELGLREATGTSAVGLEREGQTRVNPGADEVLQEGDVLVVLGSKEQVKAAQEFLLKEGVNS
jgi:CPA2 family monovalent cation:H+ antiporter-2